MKKRRLQNIINELKAANLTEQERAKIYASLGIEEIEIDTDIKIEAVESFIELASADENAVAKYGEYIDEYYMLSISNRKKVCDAAYKYFIKYGSFDIDVICTILIPSIACDEKDVDPVVSAMQESAKLLEGQPNIDFSKVRMENTPSVKQKKKAYVDPIIEAIQRNNKLYNERPEIDFSRMKYDI